MVIWKQFIKHLKKMMNCRLIKEKRYELDDKKPKQNKDQKI